MGTMNSTVVATTTPTTTDISAGTRALMRAELESLHTPLRRLQRLSFCLGDDPADLEIRSHLAVILTRRAALERDLSETAVAFMSSDELLDLDHHGHT